MEAHKRRWSGQSNYTTKELSSGRFRYSSLDSDMHIVVLCMSPCGGGFGALSRVFFLDQANRALSR